MIKCSNLLNEGLRPQDLRHLVYSTFQVDSFKSKMGDDQDVCVVTFRVKYREPAIDLMEFIEKGFRFVLDADVSSGENVDGEYYVFVELPRVSRLTDFIADILKSVSYLTGINKWSFRYHKSITEYRATVDYLKKYIPESPIDYNKTMQELKENSLKKFFSKTLLDDFSIDSNDVITLTKPYNRVYQFKLISENANSVKIDEDQDLSDSDKKEIFWLTKVIGNYNITKVGEHFIFKNGSRSILLQRM